LVIGQQQTAAVTLSTERTFTVRRCSAEGAGGQVVIEGSEKGYDDNPPIYRRMRVDLATAQKTQEEIQPAADAAPAPLPASRIHVFPQGVPESMFWTAAARENLTDEWRTLVSARDAVGHAVDAAVKAADFSRLDESDEWRRKMNEDPVACGIHVVGKTRYLWTEFISGNSYATIAVAKLPETGPVEWCRKVELQIISARSAVSRNDRWFAQASSDGVEPPLIFVDLTEVTAITPKDAPAKLLAGMAFNGDSTRFAALTEVDEIMIYDMDDVSAPLLLRRVVLGTGPAPAPNAGSVQPESAARRPLVFVGDRTLVGLAQDGRLFAIDVKTGEILWTRSTVSLAGAEPFHLAAAPSGPYFAAARGSVVQLFHATTGAALTDPANLQEITAKIPGVDAEPFIDLEAMLVAKNGELAVLVGPRFLLRKRLLTADRPQMADGLESFTGISVADGRTPLKVLPVVSPN
jgi:PQQ enzyme repeat